MNTIFHRGFFIGLAGGILLSVLALTGVYLFLPAQTVIPIISKTEGVSDSEQSGLQRFTHPRYPLSFLFPDDLNVGRHKEGNASETILFQPLDEAYTLAPNFQIFVTPYGDVEITEERLAKDIPNGDVREPVEVFVGKEEQIRALIFKSSILSIGDTREVWFIHDGFIYEFTTPIEFDAWLANILKTITFEVTN